MKVIFLDFDGVLNSEASFRWEHRKGSTSIHDTLCPICTSNFQVILDKCPDVKIVISSTWRKMHDLDFLKNKLTEYGIDSTRVIGVTPDLPFRNRGHEISAWLEEHPEVTDYVILDDNADMGVHFKKLIITSFIVGLTVTHAKKAIARLNGEKR